MTNYDRSQALLDSSLALRRFRQDRGNLSHHHWMGELASDLLSYTIHKSPETEDPKIALGIKDKRFDRKLGDDIATLKKQMSVGKRWRYLSTTVLLTSAFERFMLGIATSAASSDPALNPGFPKRLDGLVVEKYNLQLVSPALEQLTKGDWSARIAAYKRLFKAVPDELRAAEGELEKMRIVRNAVAHRFGFDHKYWSPHLDLAVTSRRPDLLSARRDQIGKATILKWLDCVGKVSESIDKHLTSQFIGGYEVGAIYVEWNRNRDKFEKVVGVDMRRFHDVPRKRFSKVLASVLDSGVGRTYTTSLCDFIDKL